MEQGYDRMYSTANVHIMPYMTPSYCPSSSTTASDSTANTNNNSTPGYITVSMNRICTTTNGNNANNNTTSSSTGTTSTATSTMMTMTKTLSTDFSNETASTTSTDNDDDDVNYYVVTSIHPNQSCTVPNRNNYGHPYKPIISTTADNLSVIERTTVVGNNNATADGVSSEEYDYNFCHYASSTVDINSSASLSVLSFNEILVFDYYKDTTYNVSNGTNDLVCVNIHDAVIGMGNITNVSSSTNNSSTFESPPPIPPFMMNHPMDGNKTNNNNNSNANSMMNGGGGGGGGPPITLLYHYHTVNTDSIWEQIKTLFQLLNNP